MAGRVLVRFLRASIDSGSDENCTTLQKEIEYIRSMLAVVGERVPLARKSPPPPPFSLLFLLPYPAR